MVAEPNAIEKISRLPWTDRARLGLAVILVAIVVAHAAWPNAVTIDHAGTILLVLAAVVVLAPLLASAEFFGSRFDFREKFDEAADLERRLPHGARNGPAFEAPDLWQPPFIDIDAEIRREIASQPVAALGAAGRCAWLACPRSACTWIAFGMGSRHS